MEFLQTPTTPTWQFMESGSSAHDYTTVNLPAYECTRYTVVGNYVLSTTTASQTGIDVYKVEQGSKRKRMSYPIISMQKQQSNERRLGK